MHCRALQRGYCAISLTEVLPVIAALAIASFIIYPRVQAQKISEDEAKHIGTIVNNIHKAMPQRNYTTLNTGWANQAGIFPKLMNGGNNQAGAVIRSTWQEPVTLASSGPSEFALTYHNTPMLVCIKLVNTVGDAFNRVHVIPKGGKVITVKDASTKIEDAVVRKACTQEDTAHVVFLGK